MDLSDIDPEHLRRSNNVDSDWSDGWWDRLIANSPLWSSDGSSARAPFPIINFGPRQPADAPRAASADAPGMDVPGTDTDSADNDGANAASGAATGANAAGMSGADTDGADANAERGAADDGADTTGPDAASATGPGAGASGGVGGRDRGRDQRRVRSSWVVVGSVREVAQELALTPLPDDVDMCLAEAEELLFARDRITSALADRVGRVHRAGQARQHGHASTRCWLRTSGGMTVGGAGRLLTLGAELPRLPT
ncbi:hypothetical protein FLW53_13425, partial [Microbispora sp. SCL1-1]